MATSWKSRRNLISTCMAAMPVRSIRDPPRMPGPGPAGSTTATGAGAVLPRREPLVDPAAALVRVACGWSRAALQRRRRNGGPGPRMQVVRVATGCPFVLRRRATPIVARSADPAASRRRSNRQTASRPRPRFAHEHAVRSLRCRARRSTAGVGRLSCRGHHCQ